MIVDQGKQALEARIRELHDAGDYDAAATTAIEGYGSELLGFLIAVSGDDVEGREVFAQFCADLWAGIEGFRFRSSFRTWAYALARNALSRSLRDQERWAHKPLSEVAALSQLEAPSRTATPPVLRTEIKDQVSQLRSRLTTEEQTLLILRINRGLSWSDVARVMLEPESDPDANDLRREAASCRKRFERIKVRLRRLANEEGLLSDHDEEQ